MTKDGTKNYNRKIFSKRTCFRDHGRSLVIAETYKHRLWKGDWNADTCEWTNEEIWCEVGVPNRTGGSDGLAFNEEGNLYVAVYGTRKIKVVSGDGKVIEEILLPGRNQRIATLILQAN